MNDEKRLYIIGTIIYIVIVIGIYLFTTGMPGQVSSPKPLPVILGIDIKQLGKACLSAFGPAFFVILLINRYIWRWRWFRFISGIRTPCVHGRWEGYLLSTYTQHSKKHDITVEFWQTLRKIQVWYYDENAVTRSLIADFVMDAEGGPIRIYCIYLNQPIRTHQTTLQYHQGVMDLYVDDDAQMIRGTYYNNPHQRNTYGEMHLRFVNRKLLKRFKHIAHESER